MTRTCPNSIGIDSWLKLSRADGVGPVTFKKLIAHFGSPDRALGASASQLAKIDGIGAKTAGRIAVTRDKFDAHAELQLAERLGVWLLHLDDSRYPPLLKRIYDPPPVLYVKGTIQRCDNLAIAIVGSRRCSLYGREQAARFAHMLAAAGFTICSGMAYGIDTAAHQGALAAGGRTIAVQGCGLANVFPAENKGLFDKIAESGASVSELPLSYEPLAENFPPRNRIIAGLTLGTIVIEAGNHSGALLTARAAVENGREVMAIPGKIDSPLSRGSNRLIKEGATLIESVEDVMDALGHIGRQLKDGVTQTAGQTQERLEAPLFDAGKLNLSDSEKTIYNCLGAEPLHLDELISQADLPPGGINAALISLRLKGLIRHLPGSHFCRR